MFLNYLNNENISFIYTYHLFKIKNLVKLNFNSIYDLLKEEKFVQAFQSHGAAVSICGLLISRQLYLNIVLSVLK